MYLRTLVVLPCLLAGVFATTHNLTGSFSDFKAVSMKSENHAVGNLYSSCKEFDQDGDLVSIGKGCVATLLWSTYQVLSAATQVQPVAIIQNGTVLDQETSNGEGLSPDTATMTTAGAAVTVSSSSPDTAALAKSSAHSLSLGTYKLKLKRQSALANSMLLESINNGLPEQVGSRPGVRALEVSESEVHPTDGIAIRTNIHGNNAVLHVHTNGSHATAVFEKEPGSRMTRRDQYVSIAHSFRFAEETFGIKFQLNKISRANASMSDMHTYWNAFGYGNGEIDMVPAFNESDSWKFLVCDKGWGVIAGKVIALEGASDYSYESVDESILCVE
jgi:hypothetical protein